VTQSVLELKTPVILVAGKKCPEQGLWICVGAQILADLFAIYL